MKKELQEKLYKDFPLLYRDNNRSIYETCMCWGIDCGDGWFDLIYDLSSKLEPLIQEFIKENELITCAHCSCPKIVHDSSGKCTSVFDVPHSIGRSLFRAYFIPQGKTIKERVIRLYLSYVRKVIWHVCIKINKFLNWAHKQFGLGYKMPCHCKQYVHCHPAASQVKEKFGTLRFYMTGYTDQIDKLISEAECKSCTICEACGAKGETYTDGWYTTLCPSCAAKEGRKLEHWEEE